MTVSLTAKAELLASIGQTNDEDKPPVVCSPRTKNPTSTYHSLDCCCKELVQKLICGLRCRIGQTHDEDKPPAAKETPASVQSAKSGGGRENEEVVVIRYALSPLGPCFWLLCAVAYLFHRTAGGGSPTSGSSPWPVH